MKKLMSTLMAVLFLTGVSFAQAQKPPHMGMEGDMPYPKMSKQDEKKMKKNFEEIAKEIKLTDEQKLQIEAMAKADKEKKKEIRKQIKEKFKAIDAELLKENYDMNVINGLTSEVQTLQSEVAKMNIDAKIQMRSILTYDQFKQIEEIRQKNKNKFMNKAKEAKGEIKASTETVKAAKNEKSVKEDKSSKNAKASKPAKGNKSSKNTKSSKNNKK